MTYFVANRGRAINLPPGACKPAKGFVAAHKSFSWNFVKAY
jgi:hypothetical protein